MKRCSVCTCSDVCFTRGLCGGCYSRYHGAGRQFEHPRATRPGDEVMHEWEMLREQGYTKRQAAERLRMSYDAFDRAYWRARAAGDPRALPAHPQFGRVA